MDYGYFINTATGDIVSQFTTSLWLIQQAVSLGIPDVLVESINLLAIIGIMIYFDWQLALVTFCTLPFIVLAISHFNKKIESMGTLLAKTLDRVTTILHESLLMAVTVMQSYGREEYEYNKFSVQIRQAADDFFKVQRLKCTPYPSGGVFGSNWFDDDHLVWWSGSN